jgi:hypothetical protein
LEILVLPQWLFDCLALNQAQRRHLNALASILLLSVTAPLLIRLPHVCFFQFFLHIPCPGCGITHALLAMKRGDVAGAWRSNPAGILVSGYFGVQIAARLAALCFDSAEKTAVMLSRRGSELAVSALLVVWIARLFHL